MRIVKTTLLALVLCGSCLSSCLVYAAHEVRNGGAGLIINGQVMTFGSFQAGIKPNGAKENELALVTFNDLDQLLLDDQTTDVFRKALLPSKERTYVRLDSPPTKTVENLKDLYAKQMGFEASQIDVFAITNTATKQTVLLPSFYTLLDHEQSALLFHEAAWIIAPDSTYADIIAVEMAFQHFLDAFQLDNSTADLYIRIAALTGSTRPLLTGAIGIANFLSWSEAQTSPPRPFVIPNPPTIYRKVFGAEAANCLSLPKTNCYSVLLTYNLDQLLSHPSDSWRTLLARYLETVRQVTYQPLPYAPLRIPDDSTLSLERVTYKDNKAYIDVVDSMGIHIGHICLEP